MMAEKQLEFHGVECWPVREIASRARRCDFLRLGLITEFCLRKYKIGLSDLDIVVLIVLARAVAPMRFHAVRDGCAGGSQTGVWNSLERMADRDYVAVTGKAGRHTYWIAQDGVAKLKYLSERT